MSEQGNDFGSRPGVRSQCCEHLVLWTPKLNKDLHSVEAVGHWFVCVFVVS